MSAPPGIKIEKYLGLVDVHLIRIIKVVEDEVPKLIEQVIKEVSETAKARVETLGGDCLLNTKIDINTLDHSV
jgi:hypothetical protein